ncbi:MAG: DUF1553 domain-containing protein [Acidobacteria bacterium]|nr:DUF1553 domain-containing protein [Acidobacteriota bacterium]
MRMALWGVLAAGLLAGQPDCRFDGDREAPTRALRRVEEAAGRMAKSPAFAAASRNVPASAIPRRNFIDRAVFDRLQRLNVPAARLTTDEEFVRRIHLDLTGHLPSPAAIREFVADQGATKRDRLIERLIYSPDFDARWTLWLGDLLQNSAVASTQSSQIDGRNAFHTWITAALATGKSLRDIAIEVLTAQGSTFDTDRAGTNYILRSRVPTGPNQDKFDDLLSRTASTFLGIGHYDCIVCHDGRRRMDDLSVWGRSATRMEAWRMAAFFSRIRYTLVSNDRTNPAFQSWDISDAPAGAYDLNTNFGNRPARVGSPELRTVMPGYRLGQTPSPGANWRAAFAGYLVDDPMFARNLANRVWKQLFSLGLVEPVNQLDPARLDPRNPPPAPWRLQAANPELLEELAAELTRSGFGLKSFVRTLVQSSAYQLSSGYEGPWRPDDAGLFARHYPRRLEAEEIHDTIQQATGVVASYPIGGWAEPMRWAVDFPDTAEPRSNGAVANFLNSFLRGDRESLERSQASSIVQQLYLMNDPFVLNRIRASSSPVLGAILRLQDPGAATEELFLAFLARTPTAEERRVAAGHLGRATTTAARTAALEDLAWALVNRTDFAFSY